MAGLPGRREPSVAGGLVEIYTNSVRTLAAVEVEEAKDVLLACVRGRRIVYALRVPSDIEHFNVAIVILDIRGDVSWPGGPGERPLVVAARHYPATDHLLEPEPVEVDTGVHDLPVLVDSWIEPVLHFLDLISAEVEGDGLYIC